MSFGVGHKVLTLALPHLFHRPTAVVPTQPLAWELPYVAGADLKRKKKKKKKPKKQNKKTGCPINQDYKMSPNQNLLSPDLCPCLYLQSPNTE